MIAPADSAAVVARVGRRWERLRHARLFISGGSGFVGTWLLEGLCQANRLLDLDARAVVLTRDAAGFARVAPELADDGAIDVAVGDVRDFRWPEDGFTHAIHAAASSDAALAEACPAEVQSTIVDGTRRMMEFCRARGVERLLVLSSGAVYRQPAVAGRPLSEDDLDDWDVPHGDRWVYHRAKRSMESMLQAWGARDAPAVLVARPFSFVGPGLPLDRHFAVGNFVADALSGGPVVVHGDGTPVRSYLYAADMAAWLWTILTDGRPGRAYNVGSERAVTIAETAGIVAAAALHHRDVRIEGTPAAGGGGSWYVPSTARARAELGVAEWTSLEDAVRRTIAWHRERVEAR
jgi:nucleoside-diphosphate-sugar epimerase